LIKVWSVQTETKGVIRMRPMPSKKLLIPAFVLFLAPLLFFQNCSSSFFSSPHSGSNQPGNPSSPNEQGGTGADGFRYDFLAMCNGAIGVKKAIKFSTDYQQAWIVTDNCQDLSVPKPITPMPDDFTSTSKATLLWQGNVYDLADSPNTLPSTTTVALCRFPPFPLSSNFPFTQIQITAGTPKYSVTIYTGSPGNFSIFSPPGQQLMASSPEQGHYYAFSNNDWLALQIPTLTASYNGPNPDGTSGITTAAGMNCVTQLPPSPHAGYQVTNWGVCTSGSLSLTSVCVSDIDGSPAPGQCSGTPRASVTCSGEVKLGIGQCPSTQPCPITPDVNALTAYVRVIGGGGQGSSSYGGGGGAEVYAIIPLTNAITSFNVIVGAGGGAGGAPSSDGVASSLALNTGGVISANGGTGATTTRGGTGGGFVGDPLDTINALGLPGGSAGTSGTGGASANTDSLFTDGIQFYGQGGNAGRPGAQGIVDIIYSTMQ
jgi:hypothetical protein